MGILDKHWDKWVCEVATGCKLWTAGLDTSGRPKVYHRYKTMRVSRVVCEEAYGDIEGLEVCHKPPCSNILCVNLDHLYVGNHEQNESDKGRGVARFVQNHKLGFRVRVKGESVGIYRFADDAILARDNYLERHPL